MGKGTQFLLSDDILDLVLTSDLHSPVDLKYIISGEWREYAGGIDIFGFTGSMPEFWRLCFRLTWS